jgi:hypothetical protein
MQGAFARQRTEQGSFQIGINSSTSMNGERPATRDRNDRKPSFVIPQQGVRGEKQAVFQTYDRTDELYGLHHENDMKPRSKRRRPPRSPHLDHCEIVGAPTSSRRGAVDRIWLRPEIS